MGFSRGGGWGVRSGNERLFSGLMEGDSEASSEKGLLTLLSVKSASCMSPFTYQHNRFPWLVVGLVVGWG